MWGGTNGQWDLKISKVGSESEGCRKKLRGKEINYKKKCHAKFGKDEITENQGRNTPIHNKDLIVLNLNFDRVGASDYKEGINLGKKKRQEGTCQG